MLGLDHFHDLKVFIEYSNDVNDVYKITKTLRNTIQENNVKH